MKIAEEVDRFRQTQQAHASAATNPKHLKMKVECFNWQVNDSSGNAIRKSDHVFLTMKNCLIDAQKCHLRGKEKITYKTVDLDVNEASVIKKVFLYLIKNDYQDISYKKCSGCHEKVDPLHEEFCLLNSKTVLCEDLCAKAVSKMSGKRIFQNVLKVCQSYNLPQVGFTMSECQKCFEEFDREDYDQILEETFEYELRILDD